ncbi:MAG: COX15/CtaA family protein [Planctomycetes bacterium]|nr:COX15/CtaA family protein [Planctomycetota bacterium]
MSDAKTIPLVVTISFISMFVFMVLMIVAGGTVRLTGSGLSIPDWPKVNGAYMPPSTEVDWQTVKKAYDLDQDKMIAMGNQHVPGIGSRGYIPEDMDEFKTMFIIEWSHRAIAFILGLIALFTLFIVCVYKDVRFRAAKPMASVVLLIGIQAVLGGMLVKSGTSTHWLFVHLTMATIIIALMTWSFLRAKNISSQLDEAVDYKKVKVFIVTGMVVVCMQIILGALVAGSRHNAPGIIAEWPLMHGDVVPSLWNSEMGLLNNLLDNTILHQWLHRWFAWLVVAKLVILYRIALRTPSLPIFCKRSLQVSAGLLGLQIILGLGNVFMAAPTGIALVHLLVALLIVVSLSCAAHALVYGRILSSANSQSEPVAAVTDEGV